MAEWGFVARTVGWKNAAEYYRVKSGLGKASAPFGTPAQPYCVIRSRHAIHPVYCRLNPSDLLMYHQVLVERQYGCTDFIEHAEYVMDCGANVGYSAAYFLSRYPDAKVISVEPDSSNFEILRHNTIPYGDRVRLENKGIWSRPGNLKIQMDGRMNCAFELRECEPGEKGDVEVIDIPTLMAAHGWPRVDILKMDIEFAERYVFAQGDLRWLSAVRYIVIELHDQECRQKFFDGVAPYLVSSFEHGELTVCTLKQ